MAALVYASDDFKSLPTHLQMAYKRYPPWGFYQYKGTTIPVRHYGIVESKGEIRCCAYALMDTGISMLTNGCLVDQLVPVAYWSEVQLEKIKMCSTPTAFWEPTGFALFLP